MIAWGAVTFAALLASYSAFRPVRDTLGLDGGADKLPWLFIGTFIATSVASPVWSAVLAGRSRRRLVGLSMHVFTVCLVGFAVVVGADVERVAVGRVFYIWSSVFNLFVVSVFWSLLADLLGPEFARRLYGPIAAGGTLGTIAGPVLTKLLVGAIGVAGILVMSAVLLELAVIGIGRVRRAAEQLVHPTEPAQASEPDALPGGGAFTGIAQVARSPYLAAVVGYVLCTSFASTFLYLEQGRIVEASIADRAARTSYFASNDAWQAVLVLVLQVVIVRPALGWFGPGIVLAVLPIVQLVGISVLSATPSLAVLAIVQVAAQSATHGITRPARELLFTVISRDDKYRAKNAIDTMARRFGDVSSGWFYQAMVALNSGGAVLVSASIPLVAIWLGLAAVLGIGFRRRVARHTAAQAAKEVR